MRFYASLAFVSDIDIYAQSLMLQATGHLASKFEMTTD
jgi:hypothetical protein